jgi:hypothetical protein
VWWSLSTASGFASGDDRCDSSVPCFLQMTAGQKAAVGGLALGIVGGALGLLIGAVAPGDRWESIDLPIRVEASRVGAGGFALTAVVRL